MTCPTITALHAILAAYDAPAGPSKADTIKAVAECLGGACAAPQCDPGVKQLSAQLEDDEKWTPEEQRQFAVFLRRFPNESSAGIISLGSAWKHGKAIAQPVAAQDNDKLLTIIASAYQIAGYHDAPAHILDVLSDPEAATEAQVEAMLPYQVAAQGGITISATAMQEIRALITNLAAVVRVQNGNLHEDTNSLLTHADKAIAILAAKGAAQGGQDAERYRWLAERFAGYDFYWGGTPDADTEEGKGRIVIVFECGEQFRGGRDFASAIDAAILSAQGGAK